MRFRFHRAFASHSGLGRGFGLVELMVTIAIVAILAAIAFPSYSIQIRGNRVSTEANDFLSAIMLARNESITRSRGVSICAADTSGSTPPTVCGGAWTTGWMVFIDDTVANTTPAAIALEDVLRVWVGNTHNTLLPNSAQTFIRFNPRGQSSSNSAGDVTFTLKPVSDCSNKQQREILVTELGRSGISKVTCT